MVSYSVWDIEKFDLNKFNDRLPGKGLQGLEHILDFISLPLSRLITEQSFRLFDFSTDI